MKAKHTPFYSFNNEEEIDFSPSELVNDRFVQEQPLVITALTFDTDIRRVLVYMRASRDVLFYNCFKGMGLTDAQLTLTHVKLRGFTTHLVATKGVVELVVTIGEIELRKMPMRSSW